MIQPDKLIELEARYGGKQTGFSPVTKRTHTGGDRMFHNRYAYTYARHMPDDPEVIVECGVFTGTGLAIWCDLYPDARVIGLDLDVSNYNKQFLKNLGAFTRNVPEVYTFDKYKDTLTDILDGDRIDVLIDDSCHKTAGILIFLETARPHLRGDFVIFVEDNKTMHEEIRDFHIIHAGEKITVLK